MLQPEIGASPPSLAFVAYGDPQPMGSKTPMPVKLKNGTTKTVLLDGRRGPARKAFQEWTRAVEAAARAAYILRPREVRDDEAVMVWLEFYLARPKSLHPRVLYPNKRPDGDKLERAVWDCLVRAGVLSDDGRVVKWGGSKEWATAETGPYAPRVVVKIYDL